MTAVARRVVRRIPHGGRRATGAALIVLALAPGAAAQGDDPLLQLSLEELSNAEVTSVARRASRLADSAAAVHVITRQDIRLSGATTLPDVLRTVPGLHVARIDANKWAISIRGFNTRNANKLLVLIDGRSIYTPLYSGVFWEIQDTLLEDVERIEVIRGPGATLWGANAVNGVINIITRSATRTEGWHAATSAGSAESWAGELRYGQRIGERSAFRLYSKFLTHDQHQLGGRPAHDDWQTMRGGGRADFFPTASDSVTVTGEAYRGRFGDLSQAPQGPVWPVPRRSTRTGNDGGFVLGSWQHAQSSSSRFTLQAYVDRAVHDEWSIDAAVNTVDVDGQQQFGLGRRHTMVVGGNGRVQSDRIAGSFLLDVSPDSRRRVLLAGFVQDEMQVGDSLRVTIGTKVERYQAAATELLPNARALWSHGAHNVWGAVSRAVRTPSRLEQDMRAVAQILPPGALFPGAPIGVVQLLGNRDLDLEGAVAYEAGYRTRVAERLSFDVAGYVDANSSLLGALPLTPAFGTDPPQVVLPLRLDNSSSVRTYGTELAADWIVSRTVRVTGTWTESRTSGLRLAGAAAGGAPEVGSATAIAGVGLRNPSHMASLRAPIKLPGRTEVIPTFSFTGAIDTTVPAVRRLDLAATRRLTPQLELTVRGVNLLDGHHVEFVPSLDGALPTEVPRSLTVRLAARF